MRHAQVAVAVLALVTALAHGAPILVTLQDGVEYAPSGIYTGTDDTYTQVGGRGPWGNAGGFTQSVVINRHARNSLLVRFAGLDAALGGVGVSDKGQITDARLMLYVTGTAYDPTKAGLDVWRMTRHWDEGTSDWSFSDYGVIDGCSNATHRAARLGSGAVWTQPDAATYPNVWATSVSSKAVFFSKDQTYHPGYCSEVAGIAEVDATADSFYSAADILYVNTANHDSTCRYWLTEDLWPVPGMTMSGSFGSYFENTPGLNDAYDTSDVRQMPGASGSGEWMAVEITEWVRVWFENGSLNHGVLLRANGGDFDGSAFAFSEYDADPGQAVDPQYRPKLEITFVPEPCSAGLMLLGSCILLRRRR